jgi:hypothetical protein
LEPFWEPQPPLDKPGLRQLLIRQYALHEAPHWPRGEAGEERPQAVAPRVHALADLYKFLHQGEFGVGHFISSPEMFREILARELHRTGEPATEPLFEEVTPDGSIRRLNLRPYGMLFTPEIEKAGEMLVEVCLESSRMGRGDIARFLEALEMFKALNDQGEIDTGNLTFIFPPALVAEFLVQVRDFLGQHGSIPVLSHSSVYRRWNRPSYRVVDLAVLRQSPLAFLLTGH